MQRYGKSRYGAIPENGDKHMEGCSLFIYTQMARYLSHHTNGNASKFIPNHRTISSKQFHNSLPNLSGRKIWGYLMPNPDRSIDDTLQYER